MGGLLLLGDMNMTGSAVKRYGCAAAIVAAKRPCAGMTSGTGTRGRADAYAWRT